MSFGRIGYIYILYNINIIYMYTVYIHIYMVDDHRWKSQHFDQPTICGLKTPGQSPPLQVRCWPAESVNFVKWKRARLVGFHGILWCDFMRVEASTKRSIKIYIMGYLLRSRRTDNIIYRFVYGNGLSPALMAISKGD